MIPVLFALAIIVLCLKRRFGAALFLTIASGGALLLNGLMKLFFQRPRPQLPWANVLPDYSFPSGHTMNSVAFYLAHRRHRLVDRRAPLGRRHAGRGDRPLHDDRDQPDLSRLPLLHRRRGRRARRRQLAARSRSPPSSADRSNGSGRCPTEPGRLPGAWSRGAARDPCPGPRPEAEGAPDRSGGAGDASSGSRRPAGQVESEVVLRKKELRKRAAKAVKDGVDIVVAVGGDGAVWQVVNSLAESEVVLGIIPKGTGNLLAGNLKIPKPIDKAVDGARRGASRGRSTWAG